MEEKGQVESNYLLLGKYEGDLYFLIQLVLIRLKMIDNNQT